MSTELVSLSMCLNPPRVSVKFIPLVPVVPAVSTSLLDLRDKKIIIKIENNQSKLYLGGLEGIDC